MQPVINHSWVLSESEALSLQQELASKVIKFDDFREIRLIAGVDVAYQKDSDKLVAAVVVLDSDTLEIIETAIADDDAQFPYIPGLFSFRELPPLIKAFSHLTHIPDLVVCDGQGIAHPRRFGLASHLGVIFDIPSIGCGKTRLIGSHEEPEIFRGSLAPLNHDGEIVGCALRTQEAIKPLYISIGHRISLTTAAQYVLKLCANYRLPETTRKTDQLVRAHLKNLSSQ
jgi:deoxyribonuclease V